MDDNFSNMPRLNFLLEKHKQLQERSVFKSSYEGQEMQQNANIFNAVNPSYYEMQQWQNNVNFFNAVNSYNQMQQWQNGMNLLNPVNNYYGLQDWQNNANTFGHVNSYPVNGHINYYNSNSFIPSQIPQIIPQQIPHPIPQQLQQLIPLPIPQQLLQQVTQPIPQPLLQQISQRIPQHISQQVLQQIPHLSQQIVQQQVSQQIQVSQSMQQKISQQIQQQTQQQVTPVTSVGKVYVNPNYIKQPSIYMNSKIQAKSSIHVNPKLIQNMNSPNHEQVKKNIVQDNQALVQISVQNKVPEENSNILQKYDIPKKSKSKQTVNDSLITVTLTKLNSSSNNDGTVETVSNDEKENSLTCSQPLVQDGHCKNYENKTNMESVQRSNVVLKSPNTSLVVLSKRKLVRVRKNSKTASLISRRRLSSSGSKKLKLSPKKNLMSQLYKVNSLIYSDSTNKYKTNWCNKTFRNISKSSYKKEVTAKLLNTSVGLVSIGGVFYKKSRNKLVRSNPVAQKRKPNITSNKSDQGHVIENEKPTSNILAKLDLSISSIKSYKTNVSNKVKQRSLQILRNKMRKNNQTCLLFQRFGYCANYLKGTCSKVHDKKQIAVCRNFLQGKCLLDNCLLSHDVGPEKMPTCKYFLDGCCARDNCPYLHVKVSSKNPICVDFLRGYCPQGNECRNRHIIACPEFDKSGICSKGKFCPYPHKSLLTDSKKLKRSGRRKNNGASPSVKNSKPQEFSPDVDETKKRYYDETSEDLSQKRNKLMRHVNIMKEVHEAIQSDTVFDRKTDAITEQSEIEDSEQCEKQTVCNKPRRPPIGPLPAYIPIE